MLTETQNQTASHPSASPASEEPLTQFALQLDEYNPTIPDSVTKYYLRRSGFETNDVRLIRLVSVACQKFISDIVNDSLQHCRMRGSASNAKKSRGEHVLTMEDLTAALTEHHIPVKKPMYFK